MKKIKIYYTFLYENMINDEMWEDLTWIGRIYFFIPWLLRSLVIYLLSPLGFPLYLFFTSNTYYRLEEKAMMYYLNTVAEYHEFLQEIKQQGEKNN